MGEGASKQLAYNASLFIISKTNVRLGGSAKASSVSTENCVFIFIATLCDDYGLVSTGTEHNGSQKPIDVALQSFNLR